MSAARPALEVRVVDGPAALALAAAEEWRTRWFAAVGARGRFAVALAGGSTPRALNALLADAGTPYRETLPWARTGWPPPPEIPGGSQAGVSGSAGFCRLLVSGQAAPQGHGDAGERPR